MALALPEQHPARDELADFLARHPAPSGRQLAEAGYVAPHWPEPFGKSADPLSQLVIEEELARAGISRPENPIGIGWAGPTLLEAGTAEQKERYLLPLLAGEELWCQLFSEPGAGSDLASLATRAVRDGESYVVSGQKVWTSLAHRAQFGILLARTDPDARKRHGITYLICPMAAEGLSIRPIIDMTGSHAFNEVFFDEVRIPVANRVGEENDGWRLAKVTLANERVSLSGEGALWGRGPTARQLLEAARRLPRGSMDPVSRDRLVRLFIEGEVLSSLRQRGLAAAIAGRAPGPEASVRKALSDSHGQHLMDLARHLLGPAGTLFGEGGGLGGEYDYGFAFSPALTIGGGTAEVQRNIIAERLLGLPRELEEAP